MALDSRQPLTHSRESVLYAGEFLSHADDVLAHPDNHEGQEAEDRSKDRRVHVRRLGHRCR
ncbi:MAG: hypothetical protein OXG52_03405 [bacterium]|nr:hypothetical protein [bacterium]